MSTVASAEVRMASAATRQVHIPELDGIRGLAILLVVIYHYFGERGPHLDPWASRLWRPLLFGHVGVDVFFVLSGFLIGGILLDTRESTNYFRAFYGRRAFRILPLYLVWLLTALVIGSQLHAPFYYAQFAPWVFAIFAQNFAMALTSWTGLLLDMSWSLAVEEQMYATMPTLVKLLTVRNLYQVALATIIALPLMRIGFLMVGVTPLALSLMVRADQFAFGLVAALMIRWGTLPSSLTLKLVLWGSLCALLPIIRSPERPAWMVIWGFTAVGLCVWALLLLIHRGDAVAKPFRSKVLMHLGTVSYGLYMVHQGINGMVHAIARRADPTVADPWALSLTLISAILALLFAHASWRFFEGPLVRIGRTRFSY